MSVQKANKNEVRKEIADLINRIKEQSDRIGMQREIPQSELDLILHRIEELHRKTVVWSYLNELPEEVPGSQFPVSGSESAVSGSQFPVSDVDNKKNEKPVVPVEYVKPPEVVSEKIIAPEPVLEKPVVTAEAKIETPVVGTVETGNRKPETGNRKDVKSFIGFNEKLMYIRQVFKGDNAAYDAAIAQFNSMNSWDEAQAFLSVLSGEYQWTKHNEAVEIFTQTVKRRFS